jgi:hypothetical protein
VAQTRRNSIARKESPSVVPLQVSIYDATKPQGREFVLDAKALNGNPFDGRTFGR